jgi:hypothetical protein
MAPPRPQDFRAGIVGLVVALVFIISVVFGMVKLTSHVLSAESPAAGTTH